MTREQYEREKRLLLRKRELDRLAKSRSGADAKYVRDAIAWTWRQIVLRKIAIYEQLPPIVKRRVEVLVALERNEPLPASFGA
jgi:tmRNA-binding protein